MVTGEEFEPGDTLCDGRYQVIERLGRGGQSEVYKVKDVFSGGVVAIKVVPPEIARNKAAFESLRQEYRKNEGLRHQNIVSYRHFEVASEPNFLLMDFIPGQSLDLLLVKRPGHRVPLDEAMRYLRGIAAALDHAHAEGILHRDIKPGNIMVTPEGGVCLTDFGLAQEIGYSMSHLSVQPSVGTMPYMAPEQRQGTHSRESDVFQLAATFYEMLAGKPPFGVEGCRSESVPEALRALNRAQNAVLRRALDPNPKRRHSSAGEFVAALEHAGAGTKRRNRLIAAMVLAGLVALGTWFWFASAYRSDRAVSGAAEQLVAGLIDGLPAEGVPRTLAVLPFEDEAGHLRRLSWTLFDFIQTEDQLRRRFTVVDRIRLAQVMEELKLGNTGAVDPQTASRVGKLVGAQAQLTGRLHIMDTRIEVTAELKTVEKANLITGAKVSLPRLLWSRQLARVSGVPEAPALDWLAWLLRIVGLVASIAAPLFGIQLKRRPVKVVTRQAPGGIRPVEYVNIPPVEQPGAEVVDASPSTARAQTGDLYVVSQPSGAEIFLDGKPTDCVTPYTFRSLKAGPVSVRLHKDEYHDVSFDVPIQAGGIAKPESATLPPAFGTLTIKSQPEGATVFLNNLQVGNTKPNYRNERLPSGIYRVVLRKELFEPWEDTATVHDGRETLVEATLVANYGTVILKGSPEGAEIRLEDVDEVVGKLPAAELALPLGEQTLVVTAPYCKTVVQKVVVQRGSAASLNVALPREVGLLKVYSEPAEAEIFLDGKAQSQRTPAAFQDIPCGRYKVRIEHSEMEYEEDVEVLPSQECVVEAHLKERVLRLSSGVKPFEKWTNSIGMEFVYIPPGEFMMGSPSAEPHRRENERQHKVILTKGFWLQTTQVTQRQWKAVMGSNPSHFKGDDLPVEEVSWNDCQDFLRKLNAKEGVDNYRLPTEAEWEYTCRAGTTSPFYFGDTISTDQANYDGREKYGNGRKGVYLKKTTPVGTFAANAWGLFDMHGNVWEWCEDWYGEYPSGPVTDPRGATSGGGRVLRGGSWYNYPWSLRSADRLRNTPVNLSYGFGFRAARTP